VSSSGQLIFCSNFPSSAPNSTPTFEENVGGVACLDLVTQELVWEKRFNYVVPSTILGDNQNIFVLVRQMPQTDVTCLNSLNGNINWEFSQTPNNTFCFFLDNKGNLAVNGYILETTSSGLDNGPWPSLHGSYYNRRQGTEQELSNAITNQIPSSISIDEQWGWLKLPWIYHNGLKDWIYFNKSGSTSLIYSNKYNAWYMWDAGSESWQLQN